MFPTSLSVAPSTIFLITFGSLIRPLAKVFRGMMKDCPFFEFSRITVRLGDVADIRVRGALP